MSRIDIIKIELTSDPLNREYSGMGDVEAANRLNVVDREWNLDSLTGSQVLNAVDKAEFVALDAVNKQMVWDIVHLGTVNPFGIEADLMIDIFGVPSTTITALQLLRKEGVSRGVELGVGTVTHSDVEDARTI